MKRKKRPAAVIISTVILILIFSFALKAMGRTAHTYSKVTVYPGDTLWDIAKEYCDDRKDIRKAVYEIKEANKLSSSMLIPGQELIIPIN